jgi:hypothetical protein
MLIMPEGISADMAVFVCAGPDHSRSGSFTVQRPLAFDTLFSCQGARIPLRTR